MKLSLAWIFDHIKAHQKDFSVDEIVSRLSLTTAEIEHVEKIIFDLTYFALAYIRQQTSDSVVLYCPEFKREVILNTRPDLFQNAWYLIKKQKRSFVWAHLNDFYAEKEELFPPVHTTPEQANGNWKKNIEAEDYILTLDNKAITHRPDLWSHRGFAREVAALFGKELYPEEHFLLAKPIKHYALRVPASSTNPFELEIITPTACKRFAGIYISELQTFFSCLPLALRLTRINARPINLLVDATNYVMYDWGQPLHAFDAQYIKGKTLVVRAAKPNEKLTLLDNTTITLDKDDIVIADKSNALSLAGIMGGKSSAVSYTTASAFIESAYFDPAVIRKTASHLKKRTESSTRFEKNLDPHQNTLALARYLKILSDMHLKYRSADSIESIGSLIQEANLIITHDFIEKKLGISLSEERIVTILQALGFGVQVLYETHLTYHITIPTFRATKDIKIPEDITEEIGRFIGYSTINPVMPTRSMKPLDHEKTARLRTIKHHCAYTLAMHEVYNYALFDEEFLQEIRYKPTHTLSVINPLSENWRHLVTSLLPHLFKNIKINASRSDSLRFFEWGRQWHLQNNHISEKKSLSGIFYENTVPLNFYTIKSHLNSLWTALDIYVQWTKVSEPLAEWFHPYETAQLICENEVLGYAGKVNPDFFRNIHKGDAFIFELDGDRLLKVPQIVHSFIPLSKYQPVTFDVSMLVDISYTVAEIEHALIELDSRICDIVLKDFFEKEEWKNKKSLLFHITIIDEHKTLSHEEITALHTTITTMLVQKFKATIR